MKGFDIISVLFLALVCMVIAGLILKVSPKSLIVPGFALICVCLWIGYDYILLTKHKKLDKKIQRQKTLKEEILILNEEVDNCVDKSNIDEEPSSPTWIEKQAETECKNYHQDKGLFKIYTPTYRQKPDESYIQNLPDLINMSIHENALSNMNDIHSDLLTGSNRESFTSPDYYDFKSGTEQNIKRNYTTIGRPEYEKEILKKQHDNDYVIDMYSGTSNIQKLHPLMGGSADTRLANRMKYMGMQSKLSQDIRVGYHKPQLQALLEEELRETELNKPWWEDNEKLDSMM